MRVVVVLLAAAAAAVVQLGSGRDSQSSFPVTDVEEEPLRRLCGWRLANKLNKVCKGVYNKPGSSTNLYYYYRDRRAGGGSEPVPPSDGSLAAPVVAETSRYRPVPPRRAWGDGAGGALPQPRELPLRFALHPGGDGDLLQFPLLTEAEASQVLRTRERSKRGLSAECCRKVCTVSELVGYCY